MGISCEQEIHLFQIEDIVFTVRHMVDYLEYDKGGNPLNYRSDLCKDMIQT